MSTSTEPTNQRLGFGDHDNIFFATDLETTDIEHWMKEDPSRRHPPEMSQDGIVQAAVSQPFGISAGSNTHDHLTQPYLPSFMMIDQLRRHFCELQNHFLEDNGTHQRTSGRLDVWTRHPNSLIFELAVSRSLFKYLKRVSERHSAQLSVWPLTGEYFNTACQLKKEPIVFQWPLEDMIGRNGRAIPSTDVFAMGKLMRRCLRLSPDDRATAEELLHDPWLEGAND
ncbi:Serine/threonine-protein kinase SRPK [Mycena sanguinolenta]|uniref:Serine/threonine-protein kinase SRPK n=1 Tax=Mycena sanguinolenta TaxID=230812 RepID=A0A8H6YSU1_9AGAR|nr:Serine/threonine-protein kinase SRPK [Mycena sanguinolenta]